ncbi:MAG: hypothetical protein ACR2ME_09915 [Acidimicrobiia bacterium]
MKRPYLAEARALLPRADWIRGAGRWASVAHCPPLTVILHTTAAEALTAKRRLDRTGCGGLCTNDHEFADVKTGRLAPIKRVPV